MQVHNYRDGLFLLSFGIAATAFRLHKVRLCPSSVRLKSLRIQIPDRSARPVITARPGAPCGLPFQSPHAPASHRSAFRSLPAAAPSPGVDGCSIHAPESAVIGSLWPFCPCAPPPVIAAASAPRFPSSPDPATPLFWRSRGARAPKRCDWLDVHSR
jgi:hypothetical protein